MNIQKTFLLLVLISSHFYTIPSAQPPLKRSGKALVDLRLVAYKAQKLAPKDIVQKSAQEKFEDDLDNLYNRDFGVPSSDKEKSAIAISAAQAKKQPPLKTYPEHKAQHQNPRAPFPALNLAARRKSQSATHTNKVLMDIIINEGNQHPDDRLMEEVHGEFFN